MDSPYFPERSFETDPERDLFWRRFYEYVLRSARESPLYGEQSPAGETFRFFASEGFSGIVRVHRNGPLRELIAKQLHLEAPGSLDEASWRVTEHRRELRPREWRDVQALAKKADLWALTPRQGPEGFDGFHCVVESQTAGLYRAVDRWCPGRDPFGRLCSYFVSLYDSLVEPERRRWFLRRPSLSQRFF